MSNQGSTQLDSPGAGGIYAPMAVESAADWYVQQARNEGWYVGQGCQVAASGTAGKVDMSAGTILVGTTEVVVAAVTAFATTITTLASGLSSGQALWVACEVDVAGVLNFNAGAGAQSDTTHTPVKPTPTSARVVVAWLFVPYGATAVDALNTNSNTKAKILAAQQLVPGPSPTGWQYEQGTWVYASATSFTIAGLDATGYLRPGTLVSWRDGTNTPGYGVVYSSSFSTNTTVTLITNADFPIANATITAPRYSYAVTAQGFPSQFNYIPVLTGFSKNPTSVAQISTVSSTIATSLFNKTAHGLTNGQVITFSGLSTTTGVSNVTNYYVVGVTSNTFQVSLTKGGTAITLGGTTDAAIVVSVIANYVWTTVGKNITVTIRQGLNGTSSSTSHTITSPCTAITMLGMVWSNAGINFDNGAVTVGSMVVNSAGTTIALGNLTTGLYTASGGSGYNSGFVTYPFAA